MEPELIMVLTCAALLVLMFGGMALLIARFLHTAPANAVILVHKSAERTQIYRDRALVLPFLHRAETIDLSTQRLEIVLAGKHGARCADALKADLRVSFMVSVGEDRINILKAAQTIGAKRLGDPDALTTLLEDRFAQALRTQVARLTFEKLGTSLDALRQRLLDDLKTPMDGLLLRDVAIGSVTMTPLDALDPHDPQDAEAIRAITERNTQLAQQTAQLKQAQAEQARQLELQAQAQLLAHKEQIAQVQANAELEIARLKAEQDAKAQLLIAEAEQRIRLAEIETQRATELARLEAERNLKISALHNQRDVDTEAIRLGAEAELKRLEAERQKELEALEARHRAQNTSSEG